MFYSGIRYIIGNIYGDDVIGYIYPVLVALAHITGGMMDDIDIA